MNWDKYKSLLRPALDWIIKNQLNDGSIQWDEKGKCDPWDHCECLIALATVSYTHLTLPTICIV